jgi:hypothetical protein
VLASDDVIIDGMRAEIGAALEDHLIERFGNGQFRFGAMQ